MTRLTSKPFLMGVALCSLTIGGFALPAFAYTSSGSTTISGSPAYQGGMSDDNGPIVGNYADQAEPAPPQPSSSLRPARGTMSASVPPMGNSNGIIGNPQVIGQCLCLEAGYKALNDQMTAKQTAYNGAVVERAKLDAQLSAARGMPSSPSQIETIRQTSEKRIALQGQINDQFIPTLQSSTMQYNAAVEQYQQSCGGKSFDIDVMTRIQANLQCR